MIIKSLAEEAGPLTSVRGLQNARQVDYPGALSVNAGWALLRHPAGFLISVAGAMILLFAHRSIH